MSISRNSLQNGLYIGLGTLFIAIVGMFTAFSGLYVVVFSDVSFIQAEGLSLSTLIFIGVLVAAGYFAASRLRQPTLPQALLNGAAATLVVALILAVLAFVASPDGLQALLRGLGMSDVTIDLQRLTADETLLPNVSPDLVSFLTMGQDSLLAGVVVLLIVGAALGALGGLLVRLPARPRGMGFFAFVVVVVLGLLQGQFAGITSLLDAAVIWLIVSMAYLVATRYPGSTVIRRISITALVGAAAGIVIAILLLLGRPTAATAPELITGGFDLAAQPAYVQDTFIGALLDFLFGAPSPILVSFIAGREIVGAIVLMAIFGGVLGAFGGTLSATSATTHNTGVTILISLLALGVVTNIGEVDVFAAVLIAAIVIGGQMGMRQTAPRATQAFERLKPPERRASGLVAGLAGLLFVLIMPQMLNNNINNILDLIGLFVMMGLGLNIVVGFAGLLDLGYVAFFAIGAYTTGIFTTPNVISCLTSPDNVAVLAGAGQCPLQTTFWVAWPIAILFSGMAGVMLGIPVLRLRGDYLAIVTLGFGEIINRLIISDAYKPILGGAQGIVNIPSPVIDLTGIAPGLMDSGIPVLAQIGEAIARPIELSQASQIYYLIAFGLLVTAFISYRLAKSRLGRAWRAMKADEAVAQAMGINLVRTKLLAFAIGAAFSGVGGALFGSYLKSIFPNSFTLLVSINVLSLIIIGGLGSIPGVFVGALMIYGLPEALREFREFRLLMFGALLVVAMLLRPQGLIPPTTPSLEEAARKALDEEEEAAGDGRAGRPQPEGA